MDPTTHQPSKATEIWSASRTGSMELDNKIQHGNGCSIQQLFDTSDGIMLAVCNHCERYAKIDQKTDTAMCFNTTCATKEPSFTRTFTTFAALAITQTQEALGLAVKIKTKPKTHQAMTI
jgi:hypothetical protein